MLIAAGLLKENTTDAHDRELLTLVERSARRGADIVRQLLTFNRESDGARVPVQFRHLLAEMKAIVCETFPREITLVEEIPNDLWPVIADATQLHQLLVNLCVNARDAMPRGGTLLLRAENLEFSESDARSRPEAKAGPYVMLSVDDTGTGISADIVDRIFDPFFTTKGSGKGTGLGLSSVLGIVRSHGGFITVNSEPGRGSSFKIYLRAMPSAPEETSEPAAAPSSLGGNGETILVVDDEESIRDTTRHVLEKHNYRVRTAADGKEAVVAFMQHRAAVRLVLTDTMMPKMGGTALVRALRLLEPNLKFIIASGLDPELERATFTSLGVTEIVSKPCSPTALLEAIQRQLRSG